MARTSSIIVPRMVVIVGRAGCRRKSVMSFVCLLPAGLRYGSHAGIVFTQWSKNRFFAPQGRHFARVNVKFGTKVRSPMPKLTFIGAEINQ